jgi:dTDP-4-amino-4,6-dideoxygalactose transaminase
MIPFNIPPYTGNEDRYVLEAIKNHKICGDGEFTKKCHKILEDKTMAGKALLTTSGTSALEMAALLCNVSTGDDVIMSSYTFSSTANAFALRGAKIVFVDIRPDTMNIDEELIEKAITDKTKVIVPMHYAGISCEMEVILKIAEAYNLFVVEDAAQGVNSAYKGKTLGSIGHIGCYSFHETKNYSMGEGGAILINDGMFLERSEIIREKGTNRSKFLRGQVDKYTWVDIGSSYLPSELNAAYLYGELLDFDKINENRLTSWKYYYEKFLPLLQEGCIELPYIPPECRHNAHMFYIKVKDIEERSRLIDFLRKKEILAVFHYIPLHDSPGGKHYGRFYGEDKWTTRESERLLRLPMYYGLTPGDREKVVDAVYEYFKK